MTEREKPVEYTPARALEHKLGLPPAVAAKVAEGLPPDAQRELVAAAKKPFAHRAVQAVLDRVADAKRAKSGGTRYEVADVGYPERPPENPPPADDDTELE